MEPQNPFNQPPTPQQANQPPQPTGFPGGVGQPPMQNSNVTQPLAPSPLPPAPLPQSHYANSSLPGHSSKQKLIVMVVVGILVVVGGIVGFKAVTGNSSTKQQSLLAEKKTVSKDVKVSETARLDGLNLTISAVDKKTELSKYFKASTGQVFMVATVRVENKTDHNLRITPYEFKFHTTQGQLINGSDVYESSQKLPNGEIAPGGNAQGLVLFEVPADQSGTGSKVEFETSYLPSDYTKSEIGYKASFAL